MNRNFAHLIFHSCMHCRCTDRATDVHLCSHDMTAVILESTINVIVSYNLAHEGGENNYSAPFLNLHANDDVTLNLLFLHDSLQ